jgi:hypothetical protein
MEDSDDDYRKVARQTPRPDVAQMRRFAEMLSDDHSWYKKLPFTGGGEPFFVWLVPHAHHFRIERTDGSVAFREVIRRPNDARSDLAIDLRDGDIEPDFGPPGLHHQIGTATTAELVSRFGEWSYWNHGPPDQPRDEAVAAVRASISAYDDAGVAISVPAEVLGLGLVYLRATVSPTFNFSAAQVADLQARGMPTPERDRRRQITELIDAMRAVTSWIYDD